MIEEDGEKEYFTGKWAKYGGEVVNPIGCGDCHDSKTSNLVLTRPYLKRGLEATGVKLDQITHQDMRSLVCAQCHAEYYFKKTEEADDKGNKKTINTVTFPWANGFKGENIEEYYDDIGFSDWTHSSAKPRCSRPSIPITSFHHRYPSQKRRGLCRLPYALHAGRGVKYSGHHVASPLDNIANTCLNCHKGKRPNSAIVKAKLDRKEELMEIAMNSLAKAHLEAGKAWEVGATEEEMKDALQDIRHGQWRWDYSIASHGGFYHAPEETLRLLAQANNKGQEARLKLAAVLARHGVIGYAAPDFSTKEAAQALAGVDLQKDIAEKLKFKETLLQEWNKEAVEKGRLNMDSRKGMSDHSSYSTK